MKKSDMISLGFLYESHMLKAPISAEELAKKYNVDVEKINKALDKGEKVEFEHTKDAQTARAIASHHIEELLDYYDRLEKVES